MFPRTAKEIPLSEEMKSLTGLLKDKATPQELIRALLTAHVDLLFFGGIGTFIKSSTQAHVDVGDRTNDALRINGRDIRAAVIGEGANLGVTQLGRIEYARAGGADRKGGRINTDAIDNSAGVDTSDHEVNIKILMSGPLRRGQLTPTERNSMLAFMTEDVAALVLKDNYDQTLAISVAERTAASDLDAAARFMRELERKGRLDRAVESLPDDDALKALARSSQGLTRAGARGPARLREARPLGRSDRERSRQSPVFRPPAGVVFPEACRREFRERARASSAGARDRRDAIGQSSGESRGPVVRASHARAVERAAMVHRARLRAGRRCLRTAEPRRADQRARSESTGRDPARDDDRHHGAAASSGPLVHRSASGQCRHRRNDKDLSRRL